MEIIPVILPISYVIQMNALAMLTQNPQAINTVYNTAYGDRNTLNNQGYIVISCIR
jgi:hypothetical protein